MARISLPGHWKFRRLVRAIAALQPCTLTGAEPVARGILELLWEAGHNAVSDYIGQAADVADAVYWLGDPAVLVQLLADAGFLDERMPGRYVIHDLWQNAPRYAQLRWLAKHPGQAPPWRVERGTIATTERNSESSSDFNSELNSDLKSDRSELNSELSSDLKSTYPSPAQSSPGIRKGSDAGASRPINGKEKPEPDKPDARRLVPLGYELVRLGQRFYADVELKIAIKELAARHGIPYDATSVTAALDALKHARAPLWTDSLKGTS